MSEIIEADYVHNRPTREGRGVTSHSISVYGASVRHDSKVLSQKAIIKQYDISICKFTKLFVHANTNSPPLLLKRESVQVSFIFASLG